MKRREKGGNRCQKSETGTPHTNLEISVTDNKALAHTSSHSSIEGSVVLVPTSTLEDLFGF